MPARRWGKFVLPLLVLAACNDPADPPGTPELSQAAGREGVRFATFNASLNRGAAGQLITDLSNFSATTPGTTQAKNAAETIQRIRPDVVLINEFDFDAGGTAARLFQENYLSQSINGSEPITYPYRYVAPSNTGIPSGFDLNNNGVIAGGDDAFGFGAFPGQFGMAVYSMYPILESEVRTFQKFLWKDMPGAMLPDDPATAAPADWYSPAELARVPAVIQEPLGPADPGRWESGALPGEPSDPAGVRRRRGPERHPELRRDPVLGRLPPAVPEPLHLRRHRHARRTRAGRAVRDRGRPELRSAGWRQPCPARSSSCSSTS